MTKPYYSLAELAELFGLTQKSLLNSVGAERFPVPTYKIGKSRVADKVVVSAYFDKHQQEGLAEIAGSSFFD
tara:strand:- start:115 stop:330 length:216 start_codon:yes stop_codon:yes gene_type:complete